MNRREAIGKVTLIIGGALIGANYFLSGCRQKGASNVDDLFTPDSNEYLNEIADTILPGTKSPGAKAANVGSFIAVMVRDCYTKQEQKIFVEGLKKLNDAAYKRYGNDFMGLATLQRIDLLVALDKEQKAFVAQLNKDIAADAAKHKGELKYFPPDLPQHYFTMMKQLTLLGYFTSEIGCSKALRYIAVPGRYDGDIAYKKGDKAWAI